MKAVTLLLLAAVDFLMKLPVDHKFRRAYLVTCAHACNFRARVMMYGQIRTVFSALLYQSQFAAGLF